MIYDIFATNSVQQSGHDVGAMRTVSYAMDNMAIMWLYKWHERP
jgi:hypothetical protein